MTRHQAADRSDPAYFGLHTRKAFRPEIEGLRAVAISAVIAHHLFAYEPGFIGVDVFFVVSGYLIGGLLFRELFETGTIDIVGFIAKRMRRLVPNALLVLITISAFSILIMPASEWVTISQNVSLAAVYISNFAFAEQSAGYFHPLTKDNPVIHFWSLSIEEQFYAGVISVFAACSLMAHHHAARAASAILVVITSGSFVLALLSDPDRSQANFFVTQYRLWELGLGVLSARYEHLIRHLPDRLLTALSLGALVALAVALMAPLHSYPWPGIATLWPALATALLIVTIIPDRLGYALLTSALSQKIGARSYSLYLWHWPVMVFLGFQFGDGWGPSFAALVASLLLAELAWRYVEIPFRTAIQPSLRAAIKGAVICISLAVAAPAITQVARVLLPAKVERGELLAANRASRSAVQRAGCFSSIGRWATYNDCIFGDPDGQQRVVLWGDSHAMSWFDGIAPAAEILGMRLEVSLMQACPPSLKQRYYHYVKGPYTECERFATQSLERILKDPPDIVILATAPAHHVMLDEQGARVPLNVGREIARDGLIETVVKIEETGAKVVLAINPPHVSERYEPCVAAGDSICTFEFPAETRRNPDRLAAAELGSRVVLADFIDVILCPDDVCITYQDGQFSYRDQTHLNPEFSFGLKAEWEAVLLKVGDNETLN